MRLYSDMFSDIRRIAREFIEPVNYDFGERQTACAVIYTRALKECTRHPVRAYTTNPTTTYPDRSRERLPSGRDAPVCGGNEGVDISAREL